MNYINYLSIALLTFSVSDLFSQSNDSLAGFDQAKAATEAHEKKFFGSDTRMFVNYQEREFIRKKYNLQRNFSKKPENNYNARIINPPCQNVDFEALPTGSILPSSGWQPAETFNGYPNTIICNTVSPTFTQTTTNFALVVTTPITDADCNNVPASPFGGTKIAQLNKNNNINKAASIVQTFSVTSSNWLYSYAYKGVINGSGHACCDEPSVIFNFYDCSNNRIIGFCDTLVPSNTINCVATSTLAWTTNSTTGVSSTLNWVIVNRNLSAYIGSCIKVEVIASQCNGGAHTGYCYYDAQCTAGGIFVNGNTTAASAYTSCANAATLAATPGFSTYSWNGPPGSGINNNPAASIAAIASGVYTLSAFSGSNTVVQTISVSLSNVSQALAGVTNPVICTGQSTNLFVTNSCACSYSWSNGATTASVSVSPTISTVYTLTTTDALGCSANTTQSVTVNICTGIHASTAIQKDLKVYPNPSSDKFIIEGSSNESITITDEAGKIISKIILSEKEGFSKTISGYAAGIYFVKTNKETIRVIVK